MNHTLVVFLTTLALAELPAWVGGTARRRATASIVIGLALGLAIAVRPLDGAIAAVTLGCFMVFAALKRAQVAMLLVVVAAGALPVAGLLVTNLLTTGRPLLFGYEVLWGANHSLGFHNDPSGNPHTPARALALATVYFMHLRRASNKRKIRAEFETKHVRRGIDETKTPIEVEWFAAEIGFKPL